MVACSRPTALWLSLAATFCLPGSARADLFIFSGQLTLEVSGFPDLVVPGGGIATLNGSMAGGPPFTQVSIPSSRFGTVLSVPLPNFFPIVSLAVSVQNQAMVLGPGEAPCGTPHPSVTCSGSGTLHGRSGISGSFLVGVFGTAAAPFANVTVPMGPMGAGSTEIAGISGIVVMVSGAGWTNATATAFAPEQELTRTRKGGTATTPGGRKTLLLVSPISISSNATFTFPTFLTLEMRFVRRFPEPGSALLMATSLIALVVRGHSLRRRHS